jgi:cystathionine beta-lyase
MRDKHHKTQQNIQGGAIAHGNKRNSSWRRETAIVHLGRGSAASSHSVNPPLVRASTTIFQRLADFKNSYEGIVFESSRYGRSGTSTNFELQTAMAELSNTETCIATPSGLSAIAAVIGAHARAGGHILVQEGVYGPTQSLCEKVLAPLGCRVEYFDGVQALRDKLCDDTALVFIEVPSSLTMRMLDIMEVCAWTLRKFAPLLANAKSLLLAIRPGGRQSSSTHMPWACQSRFTPQRSISTATPT